MNKSRKRKILAVTHDMGGTRALLPALLGLRDDPSYDVSIYAGEFGQPVLSAAGLRFIPAMTNVVMQEVRKIFDREAPDLLFSGTSWNSNLEQQFRNAAYAQKIPSVVVFDYWSNAQVRWHDAEYPLDKMTDIVCVMDEAYKKVMVAAGFPEDRLIVTGQPHLEQEWEHRQPARTSADLPKKILFLSQPLEIIETRTSGHPLDAFIECLQQYARQHPCQLTIRLHPKNNRKEIEQVVNSAEVNESLSIQIAPPSHALKDEVKKYDLVVGYRSMGLFEVKTIGIPTFALDIVVIEEPLRLAYENFGIPVVSLDELADLERIWKTAVQPVAQNPYKGASAKVLALIDKGSRKLKLSGGKIGLTLFSPEDISAEYISWLNDPVVCADNAHADPNNVYDAQKALAYAQSAQSSETAYVFAIRWKENGKHIGNCAISSIDWNKKTGMCTILIGDRNYWGKGAGNEAYRLLFDFAFTDLGLDSITSGQTVRNTAMIKICENAGMKNQGLSAKKLKKNGTTLDIVEFAITKNEYENAAKSAKLTNV